MIHANPRKRAELIKNMRALAKFLEDHPDVPAPQCAHVMFVPQGSDKEEHAEIDRLAVLLGATPTLSHGHYRAIRYFGPVEYRAVAIPDSSGSEGSVR